MDLIWIEDILALLKEKNFSIAAEKRNISQPAFSRRVQSLERWLGVTLVDRTSKPVRFTVPVELLEEDFRSLADKVHGLRNKVRAASKAPGAIRVGAQQALTISAFPDLTARIKRTLPEATFRVHSANYDDCVAMFLRRELDILLCYRSERIGRRIPVSFAEEIRLGNEEFIPVAHKTLHDTLESNLTRGQPIPLLSYPESSFLGKVFREDCLPALKRACYFETVCESAFCAGLKEMAIKGMGIAWLPRRLVAEELDADALLDFTGELGAVDLQVLVYWSNGCRWKLPASSIECRY